MDENIIGISNAETFRSSEWNMVIDLARVADLAGKKIKSQKRQEDNKKDTRRRARKQQNIRKQ